MKIERDQLDNRIYLYFSRDTFIHTENEWPQFWHRRSRYNWIDFHILLAHFERDYVAPGWEFEFRLLGLGFRIRHTFREEWDRSEVAQRVRDVCDAP